MAARKRLPLDMYDGIPAEMRKYLRFHGWHFNKKACDFAVSLMRKKNASTGKTEKIEPFTKDQVDSMLAKYGVTLENNVDYDYVYVANMGKADLLKSSITDEQHLALYVKDVVDDVDAGDGEIMREWDAKMTSRGYSCRLGRNSMIAGKFYLENYANWHISYFIMTDANDAEEILDELYSLRCSRRFLNRAKEILYSNRHNIGIAYSNPKYRRSAIVVSKTTDIWEFFNSFAHEVDHIEKHIAKTLNFSPYSESASYLVGEIIRNMFYNITRKMLC